MTKLRRDGTAIHYSTYLGGSGDETGFGVALGPGPDPFAVIAGERTTPQPAGQGLHRALLNHARCV